MLPAYHSDAAAIYQIGRKTRVSSFLHKLYRRLRYGQPLIVVSGLPRSGTSMVMQMLEAGGVEIVADFARAADPDNPEGYYELERVKDLDRGRETAWLAGIRGKAVKIVSHYLRYLPHTNNYRVIFVHRNLDEILASQAKMLARRGEQTGTDDARMKELYSEHLAKAARELAARSCFDTLDVQHGATIRDPAGVATAINRFFGGALDEDAMASVVNPDLYRNRALDH
jgi:16S rRNA G1207 methylase RsmC